MGNLRGAFPKSLPIHIKNNRLHSENMALFHTLRTRIIFSLTTSSAHRAVKLIAPDIVNWQAIAATILLVFGLIILSPTAVAQSDIRATLHNLSKNFKGATDPRTVKATTETQVCVFCHTPHNASTSVKGPLWNRTVSATTTYTRYTSSSLDANSITNGFSAQPGGSSILCLSCHDGVIALGNVNVLPKNTGTSVSATSITLSGSITTMPAGTGATTGYTRLIGTNLTNDHPISISYTDTLASADGELRPLDGNQSFAVTSGTVIGVRKSGFKPLLPLEPTGNNGEGQVQCATCHDPHITKEKFLRLNRFQTGAPSTNGFDISSDQICLACHPKLAPIWAESAHAVSSVADETYAAAAATLRGFPGTKKVWEVACLNCHDTHTAQGSRRLLREGVGTSKTATGTGADSYQPGSTETQLDKVSAIENTCYQCHKLSTDTTRILSGTATGTVPDIKTEFERAVRMPIDTFSQKGTSNTNTTENHDIRNANFIECRRMLGNTTGLENSGDHLTATQKAACESFSGSNDKRHVECTDCHNPHRVRRNSKFYGTSTDGNSSKRTHDVGGPLGNVASGVLRGAWGVEPIYTTALSSTSTTANSWTQLPDRFDIKKGDPTSNSYDRAVDVSYLTREYQLCFKCHSSYAIGGGKSTSTNDFPLIGNTGGGTAASNRNGMTRYTNVAAEFGSVNATDPPSTGRDQGETGNAGTACGPTTAPVDCAPTPSSPGGTNNHRSWHPVAWPTGRDRAERGNSSWSNLRAPYALADVGRLTMHCSDCHGSTQSWKQGASLSADATTSGPDLTKTQGPHGSDKAFLLKGIWDTTVTPSTAAGTNSSGSICGRCHDPKNATSGFAGSSEASHGWEVKAGQYCMFCHIAVPHGWKNKAFLVNLNCVQEEGGTGFTSTCKAGDPNSNTSEVTLAPYYNKARLRIESWAKSGNWQQSNCGGESWMSSACGT
jgi:ssDNA-binding Zn-finger/Zn-ribbon topoisomerase 1